MSPKYSFVLPAYKATFLRESIDSILNQTYKDFELIIVNDASPEDLNSIVNSYNDERIQFYVNEKNIGGTDLVAQWNHCTTYATGDYLILASDDDVYHPQYLEKIDTLTDKYPEVNVFCPQVQYVNSDGELIKGGVKKYPRQDEDYLSQLEFTFLRFKGEVPSGIPYYIFKRDKLIDIGGFVNFPTAWFSDDATIIRMAKDGLVIHPETLFSFRHSTLNISCMQNTYHMMAQKLLATDSFYWWYLAELKTMKAETVMLSSKFDVISSSFREQMLKHVSWLIKNSEEKASLLCWRMLGKLKFLNAYDCITIYSRVIIERVLRTLKHKK